jgi:peptide deformylase
MILPMYIFGQSVLRKSAETISSDYPNLKELISNMFETLRKADGVGLAAPQVGLPIRLAVIDLDVISDDNPEYKDFRQVYINPEIIETSEETCSMEEGCLSIPGIHESVKRPVKIRAKFYDENMVEHDEWFDGFLARAMQHEFDHLNGKMFVDQLSPFRKQLIKSKLINMTKGKIYCNYKVKSNNLNK